MIQDQYFCPLCQLQLSLSTISFKHCAFICNSCDFYFYPEVNRYVLPINKIKMLLTIEDNKTHIYKTMNNSICINYPILNKSMLDGKLSPNYLINKIKTIVTFS